MKEFCCSFGEDERLAGIVTVPACGSPRGAVVLVNAGLVPKFGPFRLYTELARRLAEAGFSTLRFDLGGLGNSLADRPDLPLRERTERDVVLAIDWLSERVRPAAIVVGGLCSGAEDSFRVAEKDGRISGVVMVDPFAYRTLGFFPRHWLHRGARRVRRALGRYRPLPPRAGETERAVTYTYMPRVEATRILENLVERKARVHFVYTGGASESFNHTSQLRTMFPRLDFRGLVTVDHLPELEHTQMLAAHRRSLTEAIARRLDWVSQANFVR